MKKLICIVLASFSLSALIAQTNPPQRKQGNTDNQRTNAAVDAAQPGNQVAVPDNIRNRYNTDYPNTQPLWTRDGTKYRAEYQDQASGSSRAIIYDSKGNPLFTEKEVSTGGYPVTITDYYSKTYPNETYRTWSSQDDTGNPYFYIVRDSETIYFDEKGNYMRSSRRMEPRP